MGATKAGGFKIKRLTVKADGYEYYTYRVSGWLRGQRIRRNFKSKDEADGERERLEIAAANAEGEIRPVNTRLTSAQVAQAEAAFLRLGDRSLGFAVEWFLDNYRPPSVAKGLAEAVTEFKAAKKQDISAPAYSDYSTTLRALNEQFPNRHIHTLTTEDLEAFLATRGQAKKTWNNNRGYLHAFFEYCRNDRRRWITANPAKPLKQYEIARGIPEIVTSAKLHELFAYLETYSGPPKAGNKPGYLIPFFALATFAGVRPSSRDGELAKIHAIADKRQIIDLELGVIRITPDIAKTDDLRQVTIQPNLAAWLTRYPLKDYPIKVANMDEHLALVRKRFNLGHDVLRHTFVSAHVSKFKSIGATALEAGNSERIIKKHYLNMMTEAEASAFWGILPKV